MIIDVFHLLAAQVDILTAWPGGWMILPSGSDAFADGDSLEMGYNDLAKERAHPLDMLPRFIKSPDRSAPAKPANPETKKDSGPSRAITKREVE